MKWWALVSLVACILGLIITGDLKLLMIIGIWMWLTGWAFEYEPK